MSKIVFAIVGGGWRPEFYLNVAKQLPELFEVCAVVETNPERVNFLRRSFDVNVVPNIDGISKHKHPQFLVLCLPIDALMAMIKETTSRGYYVLTETFMPESIEALSKLYKDVGDPKLIQVAEQYWFQPIHAARLNIIKTGILGTVSQVQVSVGHGYHGVSLLRKYLGVNFENCSIFGKHFSNKLLKGPRRGGYPNKEDIVDPVKEEICDDIQEFALFFYGEKWGVFDFTEEQYWSRIRKPRVLIRGERGEIANNTVSYLEDYKTPVEYEIRRVASGVDGSMDSPHIVGITAADRWYFKNPYGYARISDDEVAIATVLDKMSNYVKTGESFYSFEEGLQDQYLMLMIKKSAEIGKTVETENQIWVK